MERGKKWGQMEPASFGVYERGGSSYKKKCFSLAADVFHTASFSSFLGTLAAPCAAPAGGRCIDGQGWPITPICWNLPVSAVKGWLGASSTDQHHPRQTKRMCGCSQPELIYTKRRVCAWPQGRAVTFRPQAGERRFRPLWPAPRRRRPLPRSPWRYLDPLAPPPSRPR